MSAADQPGARPAENQAFDLSRMSEQEVAAEIERRVAAFKLARHGAPERAAPPPTEPAPVIAPHDAAQAEPTPPVVPAVAPPDLPPTELSPTDLPLLGEAPPPFDRVMALRRRGRARAELPIGTEEDAPDFTPDFSALLAGKEDIALDLGAAVTQGGARGRAAARAATRPRPPIEFRTGFFSGIVTALVLAAGGIAFWSFGGDAPLGLAAISHDAPAARPSATLAQAAPAPTHATDETAPRAAFPAESWAESGPEIRTAAAFPAEESAAPRLAPVLKPAVQQAAAAPRPAAKPKPAPARAAASGPFDPLLDFLEPLTSQIDRSATPPAPRPENAGRRGD